MTGVKQLYADRIGLCVKRGIKAIWADSLYSQG